MLERGDETDRIFGVARREHDGRKTSELLLDLGDAQRAIGRAAPLFDLGRQDTAVLPDRFDPHGVTFCGAPAIELRVVQEVIRGRSARMAGSESLPSSN